MGRLCFSCNKEIIIGKSMCASKIYDGLKEVTIHVECWRCERLRNKRRKLNANLITNNIVNENKCSYLEKNNLKI